MAALGFASITSSTAQTSSGNPLNQSQMGDRESIQTTRSDEKEYWYFMQEADSYAGGTGTDSLNLNMPESGSARYEAGSPNIVAIYGLNAALKWLKTIDIEKKEREMTKFLLEKLSRNKKIILFHPSSISPFGIVSFAVKGYKASDVGLILSDEFDICVRTGYHCAPFVHDFIESTKYGGTIRVSLGYFNTMNDIESLIEALNSL